MWLPPCTRLSLAGATVVEREWSACRNTSYVGPSACRDERWRLKGLHARTRQELHMQGIRLPCSTLLIAQLIDVGDDKQ